MNVKKISAFLVIYILIMGASSPVYQAASMSESEKKIAEMQKEIDNADDVQRSYEDSLKELEEISSEVAATEEEIQATEDDIKVIEGEINTIQKEIDTKEEEISEIEAQLPPLIEEANQILLMLQHSSHQNYLLDQLFASDGTAGTAIRKTNSLSVITSEAVSIVNQVLEIQRQVEAEKAELQLIQDDMELAKNDLEAVHTELENEQTYLAQQEEMTQIVVDDLAAQSAEAEGYSDMAAAEIQAQEDMLKLMEDAGCSGDDVYGVDCGVIPPAPAPSSPVASTDPDNGGSSGGGDSSSGGGDSSSGGGSTEPVPSGIIRPMQQGVLTQHYGTVNPIYSSGAHKGTDLSSSNPSEPIYSITSGTVTSVSYDSDYGNLVAVTSNINGQMVTHAYAHMSSVNVSVGQTVTSSTQLGTMGNTGMSYGSHLHLQMNLGSCFGCGPLVDPESYVSFPPMGSYWYSR